MKRGWVLLRGDDFTGNGRETRESDGVTSRGEGRSEGAVLEL